MNQDKKKRYQLKVPGRRLTELVAELATNITAETIVASKGRLWDLRLYGDVQAACVDYLKRYIKGFHVCGCTSDCDAYAQAVFLKGEQKSGRHVSKDAAATGMCFFSIYRLRSSLRCLKGALCALL